MSLYHGRTAGVCNYSKEELSALLDIVEEICPTGPDQWNDVVDRHSARYPGRKVTSIRRKYRKLSNQKIPDGDMPPEVRQAKRINHLIGAKLQKQKTPTGDPHMPPIARKAKRIKYSIEEYATFDVEDEYYDLEKGVYVKRSTNKEIPEIENEQDDRGTDDSDNGASNNANDRGADDDNADDRRSTNIPKRSPVDKNERSYSRVGASTSSADEFSEFFKLYQQDREERRRDWNALIEAVTAMTQIVAKVVTPTQRDDVSDEHEQT